MGVRVIVLQREIYKGEKKRLGEVHHEEEIGPGFFPLDEELALLPGRLAPSLQEHLTHVASWMPFGRAAQMLTRLLGVQMSKATIRRHPLAWGALYEQQQSAESKQPL